MAKNDREYVARWLSDEIERWRDLDPFLIRAVAYALAIEMPEPSQAPSLSQQLIYTYRDVPWISETSDEIRLISPTIPVLQAGTPCHELSR